jgi:hypothetical protein
VGSERAEYFYDALVSDDLRGFKPPTPRGFSTRRRSDERQKMRQMTAMGRSITGSSQCLSLAAFEDSTSWYGISLAQENQRSTRSLLVAPVEVRLESSLSMKASLSIDRLVDLSLNYQYKIVTKKRLLAYSFFCGRSQ